MPPRPILLRPGRNATRLLPRPEGPPRDAARYRDLVVERGVRHLLLVSRRGERAPGAAELGA
ncbi:hypothetical protein ABZ566_30590, partial [Streptomyces hygroscopicus]|uniref:hypothetical protein n=1 Tax=Streptomyces hygroscopicus TaxID=1912 RepID=UPI0033FDE3FF